MSLMELLPKTKMERQRIERNNVAMGAAVGVAVGAVAGVLLAPKAGKLIRQELAADIHELPERAKAVSIKTQQILGEAKEKITAETKKIMSGTKEQIADISDEVQAKEKFQKLDEITEEQVIAFKHKLK